MQTARTAKSEELEILSCDPKTVLTTMHATIIPPKAKAHAAIIVGPIRDPSCSFLVSRALTDNSMPKELKATVETAVACR